MDMARIFPHRHQLGSDNKVTRTKSIYRGSGYSHSHVSTVMRISLASKPETRWILVKMRIAACPQTPCQLKDCYNEHLELHKQGVCCYNVPVYSIEILAAKEQPVLTKVQDITSPMTSSEKRATWSLASIYALRMLGLFLIMPVLSLFAEQLEGSTPSLIGMAIGIYGISQAILQIPFGLMSDRFGRKRIIIIGLILFLIGSVVAALSSSIYGVLLGRAIQGSGAIAATYYGFGGRLDSGSASH